MPVTTIDEVVRRIETHGQQTGVHVIAIDGPSGAGKSTLAARLAQRIAGSTVVQIDDFISWADPTGIRWWTRFEQQVLDPALAGLPGRYQVRDWVGDEFGEGLAAWRDLPGGCTVIVEGVTSARARVRRRGVFTIWVEASVDERLARGLARDGESHRELWLKWMEAERDFFAADATRDGAHLRVDGNPRVPHDPATQVVLL